jgi:uncharacterized protein
LPLTTRGFSLDNALGGTLLAAEGSPSEGAAQQRILIVTGEDYPGHKWQETTPVVKEQLAKDDRWTVEVIDDLKWLREGKLEAYDAVVMHFKNYDPEVPGAAGQENLERYVRAGGGLVLLHFACGAFQEWPEFVKIAGRVWNPKMRGHDPHGTFRVEIVDREHPITQGLEGFETTDELYTCLDGSTPIRVLAESQSKVDQKPYAMAFVLEYGQGRVFHSPLGHDAAAFRPDPVGELLRRGTAWAAGMPPQK